MSQLIQLKQRIKAIEVIKKITHAMRLISMSSRLKMIKLSENLHFFRDEITPLLCSLETLHSDVDENQPLQKNLLIVIASEKGLCGNFNSIILNHFENYIKKIDITTYDFITVGKHAGDYLAQKGIKITARHDKFSPNQLNKTANSLYEFLMKNKDHYTTVTCLHNRSKSFFVQEPCEFQLLPVQPQTSCNVQKSIVIEDYYWVQKPEDVVLCIFQSFIKLNVLAILSESIISEQSSRFLSMDSSTRNAENLLKKMNLEYNKIRQTKITKELTELISSF